MLALFLLAACTTESQRNSADSDTETNEKEIKTADLPQTVKNAIAAQYPGAELLEADEITQKDGKITYDVEIKHNGKVTELMYDTQGNFLGEEKDDDDDDDDDEENGGNRP